MPEPDRVSCVNRSALQLPGPEDHADCDCLIDELLYIIECQSALLVMGRAAPAIAAELEHMASAGSIATRARAERAMRRTAYQTVSYT